MVFVLLFLICYLCPVQEASADALLLPVRLSLLPVNLFKNALFFYSAKLATVSTRPRFLMNFWHFFDTLPMSPDDKVVGDSVDWYVARPECMGDF